MIVGDALDVEWGSGFDLVLLPNILHYFDRDNMRALLRKVKRSVFPTGRDLGRRVCSQSRSRVAAASGRICILDARDESEWRCLYA